MPEQQGFTLHLSFLLEELVKPNNYVDPDGALNHLHKIPFHLSLLMSSETQIQINN